MTDQGETVKKPKFNFVHVPSKQCSVLQNKTTMEYLMKWSMKGHINVQYYNFNENFQNYLKQEFVEAFFTDPSVCSTLQMPSEGSWCPLACAADKVKYELIPSSVTSLTFFDRLTNPHNGIVRLGGNLIQCMEDQIAGFYINDHLRRLLLDESAEQYNLYNKSERNEFIFKLLMHLALGGKWCQHEETLGPYIDTARNFYKDLVSVERIEGSNELKVRSIVLKVTAYVKSKPVFPSDPSNMQNFSYLIIDPFKRQLTVLSHSLDGPLVS